MEQEILRLRDNLRAEGSLPQYDTYLASRYGSKFSGEVFNYQLEESSHVESLKHTYRGAADAILNTFSEELERKETVPGSDSDCTFYIGAMIEDLSKKDLGILNYIAEIEKEFHTHPYLRAIDVYYKLSIPAGASKELIQEKVREFEIRAREDR